MGRAVASVVVPGRVAEAEELWYDRHRWAAWVHDFGHVARIDGEWPAVGSRLLWDSRPGGRGRVAERMTAYEPGRGSTVEVEDAELTGTRWVTFEPVTDGVRVTVVFEFELKEPRPLAGFLARRARRDALRRTLTRFAHERRAEV